MAKYKQLTRNERYQIFTFLEMGLSPAEIARKMERHRSTITREIARNQDKKYLPGIAHQKAKNRKQISRTCKLEQNKALHDYVIRGLQMRWSPEQISGRMRLENKPYYVCKETIYRYIYRSKNKELFKLLYFQKSKRGNRYVIQKRSCRYGDIHLVSNRPEIVKTRKTFGHWEGDSTIFGKNKQRSITTIVERKTRIVAILKNNATTSSEVMTNILNKFIMFPPEAFKTITFDQGNEFAQHQLIESNTHCRVYYCEASSPWQKGGNENMNGRIRTYLPKSVEIESLTQHQLNIIEKQINNTPRKCLGFQTPREAYLKHYKKSYGLFL